MQHIKEQLGNYTGLSMAQFNHIKQNNIKDYELVGDLADEQNDILTYTDKLGREVSVLTTGEVIKE